jgi:hypothetical protein
LKKIYAVLLLASVALIVPDGHAGRPVLDSQGLPTGLINANPDPNGTPWMAGGMQPKSPQEYSAGLAKARLKTRSLIMPPRVLPASVDNSKHKMLVPIFEQWQGSCGAASGTGYVYTYEINCLRGGLDAKLKENQYPYNWVWHFTNEGSQDKGAWNHDTFELADHLGIPNLLTYGGLFRNLNASQWMTGYEKYLAAFRNRGEYIELPAQTPEDLLLIKGWLYDHNDGSPFGGIVNFDDYILNVEMKKSPTGWANANKNIMVKLGDKGAHSMTIVGYEDSIRYDVNRDGKYTNNLDLNADGLVDISDWEIGAFHVINTWGTGWADAGHSYMLYRVMGEKPIVLPDTTMQRGLWGHIVKGVIAKEGVPSLAFKVNLTSQNRNQFYLEVGMASDINATEPEETYDYYPAFYYSGGNFPAQGAGQSSSIEVGLDLSRFTLFNSKAAAKFWLIVNTKKSAGVLDRLTLMDYTSGTAKEIAYGKTGVTLADSAILYFPIVRPAPANPVQAAASLDGLNLRNFRLFSNHIRLPDNTALYQLIDLQGNKLQLVGPGASQLDISRLPGGTYIIKSAHRKFRFVK